MNGIPDEFALLSFPPGASYELRIRGRLGEPTLAWFEGMGVKVDETTSPVQTVIHGPIRDLAALYGLINRIRDLGLTLLSVNPVETKEDS